MFAETLLITVIRKIIGKVHIRYILHQITGIGQIQNIGVFLAVLLGVCFCQLALSNTGNAMEKDLPVLQ